MNTTYTPNASPRITWQFIRGAWALVTPYWKSEEKKSAWALLIVIVGLNLGLVYITVLINHWYNAFYNSLQQRDYEAFQSLLWQFLFLALLFIGGAVYRLYLRQMLEIRWRRWLTATLVREWLCDRRYYLLGVKDFGSDNPDQRIAEDVKLLSRYTLELSLGFLSATTTLVSFFMILWTLSGPLTFELFGVSIIIPGYMVWAAFLYAGVGSVLAHLIGRKLIKLQFLLQRYEADFRYSLVRLRDNAEGVALYEGEAREEERFTVTFREIWSNWWSIMRYQKRLTWFTATYNQLAVVFPLIVAAPRYFSKAIELGGLMQISSAFGRVQDALSWFIESYNGLTEWKASVDRLLGFHEALSLISAEYKTTPVKRQSGERLEAKGVSLRLPSNITVAEVPDFEAHPGDTVFVLGPSGSGKSTLFRLLSGLWPFGSGSITVPSRALFLPQKPYIPLGSLRQVIAYPLEPHEVADTNLEELLIRLNLEKCIPLLDTVDDWAKRLSLGEQQRIGILRAVLAKPKWIFLDEATASLDARSEELSLMLLREKLPDATVVVITHRPQDETLMSSGGARGGAIRTVQVAPA